MREELLRAKIVANKMTIEEFLVKLKSYGIDMSKSAFYNKKNGNSDFTRNEIQVISKALGLNNDEVLAIFLTKCIVNDTKRREFNDG
ncbi:hypothetical protein [Enterococcus casseliflavus]|uniref:hypothetical protein n=1 Tax=Enterococcus casseliflavus TaxID=37734 RepID=UPI003D10BD90